MNKIFKLLLIITAVLVFFVAVYFFAKSMTGRVVLNNKNDTGNNEHFADTNKTVDRNINNYTTTNKTPEELKENECTVLEDGRKLCLVKKGMRVNAGEVGTVDGQSG